MCVRLNPGLVPPHARPRSAAPGKMKFLNKFVDTLADGGIVVAAWRASFSSPTIAVVKPSSIKAPNVSDIVDIDQGIGADGRRNSQKKTIRYRLLMDYSIINGSNVSISSTRAGVTGTSSG